MTLQYDISDRSVQYEWSSLDTDVFLYVIIITFEEIVIFIVLGTHFSVNRKRTSQSTKVYGGTCEEYLLTP